MNILICTDGIYPYTMGGSHRLNAELISHLISQGNKVYCVIPQASHSSHLSIGGELENAVVGLNIIRFPIRNSNGILKFLSYVVGFKKCIQKIMSEVQIDLVNIQYLPALISCYLISLKRINYLFHGPWSLEYISSLKGRSKKKNLLLNILLDYLVLPILKKLEEFFFHKCCTKYLVLSQFMSSSLQDNFMVDINMITICPGGINLNNFYPEYSNSFRLKISKKKYIFLTVRRLERRMGLENLIMAAAQLKKRNIDFDLLIGGQGPMRERLNSLVYQLGVGECVRFLGYIPEEELRRYLSISDLFLLLSAELEGFGLVMLESMACGTPALVSLSSGSSEVIMKFDKRFVCEKLEPNLIANQIEDLINKELLGPNTSKASIDFVQNNYSWERFGKKFSEWIAN